MKRSSGAVCVVLAVGAAACELPQAPNWDVGVLVPFTRQSLSIGDLLPADITTGTVDGEDAFIVNVTAEFAEYSLGQMCESCGLLHGTTAPVPSFAYADTLQVDLPAGLIGVDVITSRLGYELTNGLDFDPLRPDPDPDAAGFLHIRVRDAASATVLDSILLNGATESFPSGSTREFVLEIEDASIEEGLMIELFLDSPQDGQVVTIDTSSTASALPVLDTLAVAAVTVELADQNLDENFIIDFDSELRQDLQDNLKGALVELEMAHNLGFGGTLQISLAGSADDLFSGSSSEVRLNSIDFSFAPEGRLLEDQLTGEEIRFLAGLPELYVGFAGTASALETDSQGRPAVTFTPVDSISTQVRVTGTLGLEP